MVQPSGPIQFGIRRYSPGALLRTRTPCMRRACVNRISRCERGSCSSRREASATRVCRGGDKGNLVGRPAHGGQHTRAVLGALDLFLDPVADRDMAQRILGEAEFAAEIGAADPAGKD